MGNVVENVECLSLRVRSQAFHRPLCNLHERFELCHAKEFLVVLVYIEDNFGSSAQGVASRIREDLKRVA